MLNFLKTLGPEHWINLRDTPNMRYRFWTSNSFQAILQRNTDCHHLLRSSSDRVIQKGLILCVCFRFGQLKEMQTSELD